MGAAQRYLGPLTVEDYHTGGEPFRIVAGGVDLPGDTVAQRRVHAIDSAATQLVRALLCSEPRGHADMYGGFVTPPDDDGADFGVLFWHKDGFSTACGHGTIALGAWAVESGLVPRQSDGTRDVRIDVPSGRVTARVRFANNRVEAVSFVNVPSWVHARGITVQTELGVADVDIAYGGAMYAVVPAAAFDLQVTATELPRLIDAGRQIRDDLNARGQAVHPSDERLSGVYGTIFTEPVGPDHQRNVVVFADGQVDRSPCGSGTAARVAHLTTLGELAPGAVLTHESIVGSRFLARVLTETQEHDRPAYVVEVTGTAFRTGTSTFTVDPNDDLVPGFVLR